MRCAPFDEGRVRLMRTSPRTTYQPTTNRGPLAVHAVTKESQGRLWENIYPHTFQRVLISYIILETCDRMRSRFRQS